MEAPSVWESDHMEAPVVWESDHGIRPEGVCERDCMFTYLQSIVQALLVSLKQSGALQWDGHQMEYCKKEGTTVHI